MTDRAQRTSRPAPAPDDAVSDGSVDEPARKRPRKRHIALVVVVLLLAAGLTFGVIHWLDTRHYETTDDAFIDGDIIPISPRVAGHVEKVLVDDNQPVHAGDVLVILDARDFDARLAQANAAFQTADANVAKAQADVAADEARLQRADTELARYEQLRDNNSASQQELTNAQTAQKVAASEINATRKMVIAAQARLAEAKAALDLQTLNLSYARVTAPRDGRVTRKSVEPGAYVQPGQSLLAIVPSHVWVTANLKETDLTDIRVGQPVEIEVDAYPDMKLAGAVDSIQSGTGSVFSLMPPENATGNYVKVVQRVPVKIVFKDLTPQQAQLLAPGMSVVPRIKVR